MFIRHFSLATIAVLSISVFLGFTSYSAAQSDGNPPQPKVVIEADGTVEEPARSVPLSAILSPEGKSYMTQHLMDMQNPEMLKSDDGVPQFMKHYLDRDRELFNLDRSDKSIAGVHVYEYMPKAGVAPENRTRILINLHGGGFSGCWPGCAELESIPIAGLMRIRVISIDYREGPQYKFPAASEDVARVYQELLKSYRPKNIGVYGCSAGGMLTAMSLAWFQRHGLPAPGADGIYCAGAGSFAGDASYIAYPLGEARIPSASPAQSQLGYLSTAKPNDPMVQPAQSPEILAKFPPTLIITAARDFAMSAAIHTDVQLRQAGVESELHVWDGLFHGFFYDPDVPESKQAFDIMVRFFDSHLGKN